MKKIVTMLLLFAALITTDFAQHRHTFPVSFYMRYPKGAATVKFLITTVQVTEGTEYTLTQANPLPDEAKRWQNTFNVLTGSSFMFQDGSIPDSVVSMEIVLSNLNPDLDSTKPDFKRLAGEDLWIYLEASVTTPTYVYDKDSSFYFTPGKFAVLKIPVAAALTSIWNRTFGQLLNEVGFAYLKSDGTWQKDGTTITKANGWITVQLPHFSKFGGGGRSLGISSAVEKQTSTAPAKFELAQNYPNPFNPSTKISYSIPKNGFVSLKVYNAIGAEVSTLISGYKNAGTYEVNFEAGSLPSGIYFYTLSMGSQVITNKMMLVK